MTTDSQDVPGVYFGTSTGQVFASVDEGETWSEIASYLPAISSVDVAVLD
jgi:Neuraminidase (sialidase)